MVFVFVVVEGVLRFLSLRRWLVSLVTGSLGVLHVLVDGLFLCLGDFVLFRLPIGLLVVVLCQGMVVSLLVCVLLRLRSLHCLFGVRILWVLF